MGNYIPQAEWDAINRMEFTPTDLRLNELERKYLFAAAKAKDLWQRFENSGDADCARIAYGWYTTLSHCFHDVRDLRKKHEAAKRAARIASRHGHGGTR